MRLKIDICAKNVHIRHICAQKPDICAQTTHIYAQNCESELEDDHMRHGRSYRISKHGSRRASLTAAHLNNGTRPSQRHKKGPRPSQHVEGLKRLATRRRTEETHH